MIYFGSFNNKFYCFKIFFFFILSLKYFLECCFWKCISPSESKRKMRYGILVVAGVNPQSQIKL